MSEDTVAVSMEDLIRELFDVKAQVDDIKKGQLKALEERKDQLEAELMEALDSQGVDKTSIRGVGTVGINESVVPQATDWERIYEYVVEHQAFYLMNRALNAAAYRELLQTGEQVPGISSFTRRTLSVRKG